MRRETRLGVKSLEHHARTGYASPPEPDSSPRRRMERVRNVFDRSRAPSRSATFVRQASSQDIRDPCRHEWFGSIDGWHKPSHSRSREEFCSHGRGSDAGHPSGCGSRGHASTGACSAHRAWLLHLPVGLAWRVGQDHPAHRRCLPRRNLWPQDAQQGQELAASQRLGRGRHRRAEDLPRDGSVDVLELVLTEQFVRVPR